MSEVYMQIPMEQFIELKRAQENLNDYCKRAEEILEYAEKNLNQNLIHIENINVVNLVDFVVTTQSKLNHVELAEAKARMEIERLREALESVQNQLFSIRGVNNIHDSEITGLCAEIRKVLDGESHA